MADTLWASVVALISVVVTGASSGFSAWDKSRLELNLAQVKSESEIALKAQDKYWSARVGICDQVTEAAKNIAQTYAEFRSNPSIESASKNDANLWVAATFLNDERMNKFLVTFEKGPSEGDTDRFKLTNDLVDITMPGLVEAARDCRREIAKVVQR